ncbi:monooxygenase [Pseudenhygromyxa sp. WMMC2535]|uniref:monooxygenase n=1 Tax=Pseudenhygromyxa sp. WMMC2535 TaxID=2712867 RepID=UPI0015528539|nr:monooxygenase [Pseudenhygromyxa sp. WMMC2535]NVB42639.1 monooxygenase [Pseudenhygromyxa sp. WMMC2535]
MVMDRCLRVVTVLACSAGLLACGSDSSAEDETGSSNDDAPSGEDESGAGEDTAESGESGEDTAETGESTGEDTGASGLTYWKDTKAILDSRCVGCHAEGEVAPFSLETWEQVENFAPLLAASILDGSMPPWPPVAGCNDYLDERALTEDERETLLIWLDDAYPEGDVADAPPDPEPSTPFEPTISVALPEPYTPSGTLDDYRCFAIPWPEEITEESFVVAQNTFPDRSELVHHVITFVADPDEAAFYQGLDDAEDGPGYTCFGGPGKTDWSARWLGAWVPGAQVMHAPEGTGLRVEPGSLLIVQVHYNLIGGEVGPDQTSIGFELADSVEREGAYVPVVNYGWVLGATPMSIPAGASEVSHSVSIARDSPIFLYLTQSLGVGSSVTLDLWEAALHMHLLGERGHLEVAKSGDEASCLLEIDEWDFNWQGSYQLEEPVEFGPGDSLELGCVFDNSAENQPIVDGEPKTPEDVGWGDGTFDEMCLGVVYVAAQ